MNPDELTFGVSVTHADDETVLSVRGEVDASTVTAFRAAVNSFDGEGGRLVLDLAAVSFMDSSGLSVVAETLVRQQGSTGSLHIRNPSRQVRAILKVTGLERFVTIDETHTVDHTARDGCTPITTRTH